MPKYLIPFLCCLLLTAPAFAGKLAGVEMAETKTVGDHALMLNGMALRKVTIIKVYVAGLYLPEKATDGAAVLAADTPRHLVMHWLRSGPKDKMCDAWYEGFEANTPGASSALKGQFDTLCEWMADAEKNDEFVFTYLPGTGTEVTVKGQSKGTLEGKAFADALFASWIGAEPGPGEGFKKDLLGD